MLDFQHPNVMSLLGVCFDTEDNLPLIVLPFMANGDLKSYLVGKRTDSPSLEIEKLPQVRSLTYLCLAYFLTHTESQCTATEWNVFGHSKWDELSNQHEVCAQRPCCQELHVKFCQQYKWYKTLLL